MKKTYKIADEYGIDRNKIILDPGLGFGKNSEQNIEVLSRLDELNDMGPILLGASKKRFIGKLLNDLPFDERVEGTVATTVSRNTKRSRYRESSQCSREQKSLFSCRWDI